MKPNKYIQNSDYLSLGKIQRITITKSFGAVTIPTYGHVFDSATYSIDVENGSIIGYQMRYNNSKWYWSNCYTWSRVSGQGSSYGRNVYLWKSTNNQITIKSRAFNFAPGYSVTVPAATVDFVVIFFKPPNT